MQDISTPFEVSKLLKSKFFKYQQWENICEKFVIKDVLKFFKFIEEQ